MMFFEFDRIKNWLKRFPFLCTGSKNKVRPQSKDSSLSRPKSPHTVWLRSLRKSFSKRGSPITYPSEQRDCSDDASNVPMALIEGKKDHQISIALNMVFHQYWEDRRRADLFNNSCW